MNQPIPVCRCIQAENGLCYMHLNAGVTLKDCSKEKIYRTGNGSDAVTGHSLRIKEKCPEIKYMDSWQLWITWFVDQRLNRKKRLEDVDRDIWYRGIQIDVWVGTKCEYLCFACQPLRENIYHKIIHSFMFWHWPFQMLAQRAHEKSRHVGWHQGNAWVSFNMDHLAIVVVKYQTCQLKRPTLNSW